MRAILLITLQIFFYMGIARADALPTLPCRNAAVVLPLLIHFSPKEGYGRITEILGTEDFDVGNAYRECFFRLKDSPGIMVKASLDGKKVYFIQHGTEMLYSAKLVNSN